MKLDRFLGTSVVYHRLWLHPESTTTRSYRFGDLGVAPDRRADDPSAQRFFRREPRAWLGTRPGAAG